MVNGANARCLSWFTGKDAHAEASTSTRSRTYDLVTAIRKRRFIWLGHILRMEGDRLVKHAVKRQHSLGLPGNMFYDVPSHLSFEQIEAAASDRHLWRRLSTLLQPHDSIDASTKRRQMANMTKLLPAPLLTSTSVSRMGATTRAFARTRVHAVSPPAVTTTQTPSPATTMAKYRSRDAHALFFAPATKTRNRAPSRKKPKPTAPTGLTDKQRASEAHAHYIIHHGTQADAQKIIKHRRIRSVSAGTLSKLQGMCNASPLDPVQEVLTLPRPIPTWEEAAAVVFDSSSDSDLDESSLPPLTIPSTPSISSPPQAAQRTPVRRSPADLSSEIPLMAAAALDSSIFSSSDADSLTTTPPPPTVSTTPTVAAASNVELPPLPAHGPERTLLKVNEAVAKHQGRRQTRSMTLKNRQALTKVQNSRATTKPHTTEKPKAMNHHQPKPSKCPKRVRISESKIPGAGKGLYLLARRRQKG